MAPGTVCVAQRDPHAGRFVVGAHEEPQCVEAGDGPHRRALERGRAAVTGDAAHGRILPMVEPGEVAGRSCREALELLFVEVAGDAEAVVALLDDEARQKEAGDHEGAGTAPGPQREPPDERASDGGTPPRAA